MATLCACPAATRAHRWWRSSFVTQRDTSGHPGPAGLCHIHRPPRPGRAAAAAHTLWASVSSNVERGDAQVTCPGESRGCRDCDPDGALRTSRLGELRGRLRLSRPCARVHGMSRTHVTRPTALAHAHAHSGWGGAPPAAWWPPRHHVRAREHWAALPGAGRSGGWCVVPGTAAEASDLGAQARSPSGSAQSA